MRVILFLIDLDAELKFCMRWLILTDQRLLFMEQRQNELCILKALAREQIKTVVEIKSLGLTTLQF